ncbi:flagellar hook-associated protein 2 [Virgibacillus sp. W0430]|uniref:flagellar hook-associated protein 2 n=1 Tax=Virgibacillus sp. W0430 TaxID=3391580 RepID=UPI003F458FED
MVMRVGGLATGMDIEAMVNKLMDAERMPLTRMEQKQTTLTWKRDAFREINRSVLELDELMLNMKLNKTYNPKKVSSSQENAIQATASSIAANGTYQINVKQLATTAINISESSVAIDEQLSAGSVSFTTYNENGDATTHQVAVADGDTVKDVLEKITKQDNNIRAFFDEQSQKVIMETTRTGNYNSAGAEITFSDSFFTDTLKMNTANEKGGTDAIIEYNNSGIDMNSKDNTYNLNGIRFEFNQVTDGNAQLTVTTDVESSFNSIMKFVDTYNKMIESMNKSQTEEVYRDFKPLSDEQKEEMSEDQIEKWEEKAKSGLLRGESVISNNMFAMRQSWYAQVETGNEITSIHQIGITTTKNYLDGGKLKVDEQKLKDALRDNPDEVHKLFSNRTTDNSEGLVNRLEKTLKATKEQIEERAGKSSHTLDNYTIGKRIKELDSRITDFEARMVRVENRYWSQFTQMEKAIQRLNNQSSQLFSQFGGM